MINKKIPSATTIMHRFTFPMPHAPPSILSLFFISSFLPFPFVSFRLPFHHRVWLLRSDVRFSFSFFLREEED
jgi:hypothetical protein